MLFNTYSFIFYFLIPVVGMFYFIGTRLKSDIYKIKALPLQLYFLILVSFIFYAQWDMIHLFILCGSILINYFFAFLISVTKNEGVRLKPYPLIFLFIVISLDISLLGYFKYSGFLNFSDGNMVLPLAISFFTFQQIAYVVDIYRKKIIFESFDKYLFFVMFFPQLIAGPIVHYNEMMGQVKRWGSNNGTRLKSNTIIAGVVLFSIGLFSKVVIADSLVKNSYHNWSDIFSYSFMIYFDFSGYASMAIGLALMFGIVLPQNFNSPYKARNLIDFWRRWHITLSLFLRDHIYIPLGGNRFGVKIQLIALMATMIIGGIWHGAGWNFLLWGGMHGVGLVVLHLYSGINRLDGVNRNRPDGVRLKPYPVFAVSLTFLYVTLLWVLFFSSDIQEAFELYKVLFSFDGFGGSLADRLWLLGAFIVAFVFPNASEIIKMDKDDFGLKPWHGYLAGVLMFVSLKFMAVTPSNSFVYFNF